VEKRQNADAIGAVWTGEQQSGYRRGVAAARPNRCCGAAEPLLWRGRIAGAARELLARPVCSAAMPRPNQVKGKLY